MLVLLHLILEVTVSFKAMYTIIFVFRFLPFFYLKKEVVLLCCLEKVLKTYNKLLFSLEAIL